MNLCVAGVQTSSLNIATMRVAARKDCLVSAGSDCSVKANGDPELVPGRFVLLSTCL